MCNNVQCQGCQKFMHPSVVEIHQRICPNLKYRKETETVAKKEFLVDPTYGDDKDEIGNETYFWNGKQVPGKRCIYCNKNTHPNDYLHKIHRMKCVKIKKQCQACFEVIKPTNLRSHPCYKTNKEVEFLDFIENESEPIEPQEDFISDGQIKIEIDEEMKDSPNIFIRENIEVKESSETSKTSIDERKTRAQKKPVIKIEDLEDTSEVKSYKWGGKLHPGKKCTKCLKLVHPASFASHVKQCTKPEPPELKTYFCPLCTYKTIDQVMYEAHTKCCTIVQCYVCGDLEDASRIENHLKTTHRKITVDKSMFGPKKDEFPCTDCVFIGSTAKILKKHWSENHLHGSLSCDACKREFSTITRFNEHQKKVHSKRKCEVCNFEDEISKLKIHILQQTN